MNVKSLVTTCNILKFTALAANILRIAAISWAAYKVVRAILELFSKKGIKNLMG